MTNNIYYVYQYLRTDKTPYYIGKGKDYRAFQPHNVAVPIDINNIQFIVENVNEEYAFSLEKYLITLYGRKDNGTGILRNLTNGEEGNSGCVHSEEFKKQRSEYTTGKNNPMYGVHRFGESAPNFGKKHTNETKKKISESRKGQPGPRLGAILSEETKKKLSLARKG